MVNWTELPEELLSMIADRLFSVVQLLRFRSVGTYWRSSVSVADRNPYTNRPLIQTSPFVVTLATTEKEDNRRSFLSRASFFRVSHSSSSKGWLIKYEEEEVSYGKLPLLNPLWRFRLGHVCGSIDLLNFKLSEIQAAYIVKDQRTKQEDLGFKRVVLGGNNRLLGIGYDGKIWYWNGEIWTRLKDHKYVQFCDIIVYKGLTYALDSKGIVWWISSSLSICRYGLLLGENITNGCCRDLSLVECCREFYIVDRLSEDYRQKTVGFKVYKVVEDENSVKWVQVKSLGDNAFVMATDSCFSVLAHEFLGCLKNSIYFSDDDKYETKVFKLDDGSITTMTGDSQSCFQMFVPSFLRFW